MAVGGLEVQGIYRRIIVITDQVHEALNHISTERNHGRSVESCSHHWHPQNQNEVSELLAKASCLVHMDGI